MRIKFTKWSGTTTTLKLLGAAATLSFSGYALAQYPERPITMIVPFPPGGVADTVARPLADALSKDLGQTVVIENRAGAGGAIGIGSAANAKPDGYTILLSLSSISILPEADKILERKPAFRLDQFKPIARITADPTVLVVKADAPWKTVQEFIEAARKNPGDITYGSSGIYGTMHVPMEMLAQAADVKLTHIPYTGAGPAVASLLGGHVQALATGPASAIQQIKAGKLRALAHWGDKPLASLPDVPSLSSSGYNAQFIQWSGVFVPADAPQSVVDTLNNSLNKIAANPAFAKTMLGIGSPLDYLDAAKFDAYWKLDSTSIAQAVNKMGKIE
ncbi:Tat pathway signal protein [Pollutimonas nitritireducens]|uniref:Tat pathway signal protein n=1 Tax=Pollutimonas nitritireducens TaxID=2045209 RepID=A0A2N4UBA9_9BURK|nr:tripartite tricarboxylate transporter substrate binding protein [Pollutimonas nitritireducens]PLC52311.1 Tat pathway signal protein [Pollutimonas nitritireducens]